MKFYKIVRFFLEVSMKNVLLLVDLNQEGKQKVGDMCLQAFKILYLPWSQFRGNIFCYH